ncbi:MAG TPA: signal peptide peptidase SppA [Bryobacteraceae bacterium]|nr:signal peptide peptidase SppA [Bryobacteraceae bacterium]
MKNFLIGLFTGLLVCVLTVFVLVFAVVRFAAAYGERKPVVADGSTLIFKLQGEVPEKAQTEIPIPVFEQQTPITVQQTWENFHKAASDPKIKAVIFEPVGLSIGWAKMQEIRQEILEFKKSGKPIVSFLMGPGSREYYLASATDRIFISPDDMLDVKGLRVESMYFKNSLDKLGVQMEVIHAGKFKDAGDMFTHTAMSPETREVLSEVLDQYYGDLVASIAAGRKKTPEQVKALIDQGPFTSGQAKEDGLVDALGFEDQAIQDMQRRLNQSELKKISLRAYSKIAAPQTGNARIALLAGEGEITRGGENETFESDTGIRSGAFVRLLKEVENDSSIRGVILRIDSPGGDGVASDEILQETKNLSAKKPLVISMSDYAASGGYFMSITGDPIVAYPNTLTGSIGVIMIKPNLHGLYDKLGITEDLLKRGQFSDMDSAFFPNTPEERQKYQQEIDSFYSGFVRRVAAARKKSYDQINDIAQGRVWLGAQAKNNGLVDELGGIDKAIEMVKVKAQIPHNENITLVPYPGKRSILDVLMRSNEDSGSMELRAFKKLVHGLPVELLMHGGVLKLMPYRIEAR